MFLIVVVVLAVLAGCASLRPQLDVPITGEDASRAVGDTNLTNLVASGDVTVGGDLEVVGECVGCGGASYDVYTALLTQTGTSAPTARSSGVYGWFIGDSVVARL